MKLPEPSPEEARGLLKSPAMRDRRRVATRALLPYPSDKPRGRQRPEHYSSRQFPFELPPIIDVNRITALGKLLQERSTPLLNKFINHHNFDPTEAAYNSYCMYPNFKKSEASEAVTTEPAVNLTPIQRGFLRGRQTQHIADLVQQNLFDDRNIALERRAALNVTRDLIKADRPLDPDAVIASGSAILDFGHSLVENPDIMEQLDDPDLAENVIYIGEKAPDNPGMLQENPVLLLAVQQEQARRYMYWDVRYDAAERYGGQDRLTDGNREAATRISEEIERWSAISNEARS